MEQINSMVSVRANTPVKNDSKTSSPIDKIKNTYRWRIILKCKLDKNVLKIIDNALKAVLKYKFNNTSVVVDINPTSMN